MCHAGACQPCQLQVQQGECCAAELLENNKGLVVIVLLYFCFQCVIVAVATVKLRAGRIKRDSMVPAIFPAENSAKGEHEGRRSDLTAWPLSNFDAALRRMLKCRAHRCQQQCHPGLCQPCPLTPSTVKTCPCGQTPLAKLLELGYPERKSCVDPIPSCGKTCNRPLACGSSGA